MRLRSMFGTVVALATVASAFGAAPDPAGAASSGTKEAGSNYGQTTPAASSSPTQPQAVVPAGRTFHVRLQHAIRTSSAREGDRVTATLTDDVYAGDVLVAEAGSEVQGRLIYVANARETRDQAALEIKFDRLLPRGSSDVLTISASVISSEIQDRARRSERDADIAWTAGGALLGAVIGNQSSNRSRGRATGALIGGVTGLLISTQTGSNFTVREGTRMTLELNRPLYVY